MEKIINFDGVNYWLTSSGKYYLSQSKTNAGRRCAKGLHVAIYEKHNNVKVKKGQIVHHVDGNPYNNNPENLELVTGKRHSKLHNSKGNIASLLAGKENARKWHKSEEGKEFHKKLSVEAWEKRKKITVSCTMCSIDYETYTKYNRNFCSTKCRQRYYKANKINHVIDLCANCGKEFWRYKSKKTSTCSKSCSCTLRNLNR